MADYGDCNKVAQRALEFKKRYYEALDTMDKRPQLLEMYPAELEGLMEWNGHVLSSKNDVLQYFQNLPPTKHVIECLDAQPLPGNNDADAFIVTASGKVVYDEEHTRMFYQRFVLRKVDTKYYIVNDYLRWTGEKLE
eukprot:GILI01020346.1.p1 GENE.GILI01020346.1~~GILI01020346.1.p1  ORF type:complete len:155 (-),score=33.53 GILI01020346.1:230-640(-)